MRLPWQQIAMEVIEVSAPELGDKLYPELKPELEAALQRICAAWGTSPDKMRTALAGWGVVEAIKWGLARCPDHQPPSANAVVKGPTAARQVARAAGYGLDPNTYVEAAAGLAYPTVETVPEGVRFRGLNRYDPAWGERNKEAWTDWKRINPPKTTTPPDVRRNSAGTPPEIRRPDTDADAESTTPPLPPSARGAESKACTCKRQPCRHQPKPDAGTGRVLELAACAACGSGASAAIGNDGYQVKLCYGCLPEAQRWAEQQNPREPWKADVPAWALVARTIAEGRQEAAR
jgi:hypothetical protein